VRRHVVAICDGRDANCFPWLLLNSQSRSTHSVALKQQPPPAFRSSAGGLQNARRCSAQHARTSRHGSALPSSPQAIGLCPPGKQPAGSRPQADWPQWHRQRCSVYKRSQIEQNIKQDHVALHQPFTPSLFINSRHTPFHRVLHLGLTNTCVAFAFVAPALLTGLGHHILGLRAAYANKRHFISRPLSSLSLLIPPFHRQHGRCAQARIQDPGSQHPVSHTLSGAGFRCAGDQGRQAQGKHETPHSQAQGQTRSTNTAPSLASMKSSSPESHPQPTRTPSRSRVPDLQSSQTSLSSCSPTARSLTRSTQSQMRTLIWRMTRTKRKRRRTQTSRPSMTGSRP